MQKPIDILYLGVNMENSGYRFFPRYEGASDDYYMTFRWLAQLKRERPKLNIAIKHHPGTGYKVDITEKDIIRNSGIIYHNNDKDSFLMAEQSKMCLSYCSTMILEFTMPYLAHFIYDMRHKRFKLRTPCNKPTHIYKPHKPILVPAFYLDPGHRNRFFCRHTDDVCIHKCNDCQGEDIEIFEPLRIVTYKQLLKKVEVCCGHNKDI